MVHGLASDANACAVDETPVPPFDEDTTVPSTTSKRTLPTSMRRRMASFASSFPFASVHRRLRFHGFFFVGVALVTKIRCVQRRPTRIFGVLVAPSVHQWERFPPVRARRASRLVHVRRARIRTKREFHRRCVVADERTCVRQLVVPVCRDGRGSRSRRGCCKCVVEDASSTCASWRTKEALRRVGLRSRGEHRGGSVLTTS